MGLFDNFKKAEVCLLVERQQRSDLATCMHILLQEKCPPKIPMQWGFEDKIGERLIDVPVKRRKYIGYHNRYVFKR